MEIRNKNFISKHMTKKDVILAFGVKPEVLIEQGFIQRYYQYFRPTQLLLTELVPDLVEVKDVGRINGLNHFAISTIRAIFECDDTTARVIANMYFVKNQYGYYKRSDLLNEMLADGEIVLSLRSDTDFPRVEENVKD